MGKRSSYEKIPKDFYATIDPKAIPPNLVKYIKGKTYAEPCYGNGDLEGLVRPYGAYCGWRSDIRDVENAYQLDGLVITGQDLEKCDIILTNPPYTKDILLPLIEHWTKLKPTWLLLPATFMHVKYASPYMAKCSNIISIGRLYFFENTWVENHPFKWEELKEGLEVGYDLTKGLKFYTGWLTPEGKPHKSKFVRGVEDYCWYLFQNNECDTVFEGRGES